MSKRVVITGMGVVSPIGNTLQEFYDGIRENRLGFSYAGDIVSEGFDVKIVGSVKDFSLDKYVEKRESRRMDRFTQFAVYAAKEAVADAGSDFKDIDPYRAGVICGVGIGGLVLTGDEHKKYFEKVVSILKQRFSKIVDFRQQSKVVQEQITILFIA